MVFELLVVGAAVLTAAFLVRFKHEETKTWFKRLNFLRELGFAAIWLLVALVFIGTGSPGLVLLGFAVFLFVALYIILELDKDWAKERLRLFR